jgi:excisionase family DNA binding protein
MVRPEVDFSFDEAVRTMGITPERLERLMAEGKIPYTRDGLDVRIPRNAILDYLAEVSAVPIRDRKKGG